MKVIIINRRGKETPIEMSVGRSLMEEIRDSGFEELNALCGGSCSCATCHVYVDIAFMEILPPLSQDEDDLLDASSHRTKSSRLSCQITLDSKMEGFRVAIAPED